MIDSINNKDIPLKTKSILKTCVPYIIKYPKPDLLIKNSPDITPIKHILIPNLNADIIVLILYGNIK